MSGFLFLSSRPNLLERLKNEGIVVVLKLTLKKSYLTLIEPLSDLETR